MKRRKLMMLSFLMALLLIPGTVSAETIKGTGESKERKEWDADSGVVTKVTAKQEKKDQDGNPVYEDPDLKDPTGDWEIDTDQGDKAKQEKSSDPWHLKRTIDVPTGGSYVTEEYKYNVTVAVPYDESRWTNAPITIKATDSDLQTANWAQTGSGVRQQYITREGQHNDEDLGAYSTIAGLHTNWNGSELTNQLALPSETLALTNGQNDKDHPTSAVDNIEGATEWKIWTSDNLYKDGKNYPITDPTLLYVPHFTAENHLLKYDKTKPKIENLSIEQTRLSDVHLTQESTGTESNDRTKLNDEALATDLDSSMTTTITVKVTDENTKAFHGKKDVSGLNTLTVVIHGNNGKSKTLNLIKDAKDASGDGYKVVTSKKNREESADVEGTYSWTGNLYNDDELLGASELNFTVEVADQAGNIQTEIQTIDNNHPVKDKDGNTPKSTDTVEKQTKILNYDAVSTIIRNDDLNDKYNSTYSGKNAATGTLGNPLYKTYGYDNYKSFFNAMYNAFKYSEYATVKTYAYGSSITGFSTDFDYNGAGINKLAAEKRAIYSQSPAVNRAFGENDPSETGNTVSVIPEHGKNQSTKILKYNTRFPVVSEDEIKTKAYPTGKLEYALNLVLTDNIKRTNYRTPDYSLNYDKLDPRDPGETPPDDKDVHVRISTNHGGDSGLNYK